MLFDKCGFAAICKRGIVRFLSFENNPCKDFAFKRICYMDILHYVTDFNEDPYQEWLDGLRDRSARVAIQRRVDRLTLGNFGDHKACRDGVWELRVDFGPGYRVYYSQSGKEIVLLLCGGSKRTQATDIDQAIIYWQDYQRRLK